MSQSRTLLVLAVIIGAIGMLNYFGIIGTYYLYLVNLILVYSIASTGLVVLSGVAGLLSLGTAGLLAVGAYTTGMLMNHLGMGFLPAALLGSLATMVLGSLLAGPALRLGGLRLAIVTLALGTIVVQMIGKGGSITGGMDGMMLPMPHIGSIAIDSEGKRFVLIATVFLACVGTALNFVARKPGRALLVLKEREATARALGIDTTRYKAIVFAYSSFLAGVSGALYALLTSYISIDDFTVHHSIYFFVMIVVGGMTSIVGGILGTAVVTLLPELLRDFKEAADALFGLIMMLVIFALPGGLLSLWTMARSRGAKQDSHSERLSHAVKRLD